MEIKQISLSSTSLVETASPNQSPSILQKTFCLVRQVAVKPYLLFRGKVNAFHWFLKDTKTKLVNSAYFLRARRTQSDEKAYSDVPNFRFKKVKKIFAKGLIILAAIAFLFLSMNLIRKSFSKNVQEATSEIKGASATQDINREFSFPLKNNQGESVSELKYTIEKAELRDEIVVKGQRATAIEGRTFLIITLKIKNEHNQAIEMNTRDYIRLSTNAKGNEWLAPDIHNDPVEIQAISTKHTRVGFPLNDTDTHLMLRVGEIDGEKQEFELNF